MVLGGGAPLAVAPPKQSEACIPCSVTESRQTIVSDTITQDTPGEKEGVYNADD